MEVEPSRSSWDGGMEEDIEGEEEEKEDEEEEKEDEEGEKGKDGGPTLPRSAS